MDYGTDYGILCTADSTISHSVLQVASSVSFHSVRPHKGPHYWR